jgi:membrane protease YdiL (CAAX protease family)
MSDPRLGRGSVILIAAGLIGLACFVTLNRQAFPQAAVELAVDRNAAYKRAGEFVADRGVALGGREHAITMSSDGAAAVFLQRTAPVPGEPDLADLRIWHWRARWFRSQEKEEVRVDVGPRGQILSYEHLIPEAQAGTRIDLGAARSMAERFLTEVMQIDLRTLEEVEAASKQLDHRVDHTFEWRVLGYERPYRAPGAARAAGAASVEDTARYSAGEADTARGGAGTLRHRMRIQGDEVGLYEFDYKVPEAFEREFSAATSRGLLLTIIAFVLLIVLGLAAVVVMVRAQRRAGLRFRPSTGLGVVVLLANLVTTINLWPQLEASYSTQIPYPVFIGIALAGTLLVALIYGFIVLACAASGDHLAREQGLASSRALGPVPRPSFVAATVHGYSFAFFFLGYVTLFYLLGRRFFGVWMPAEGPFSEVLSTALPALAPLAISILAAVSEESVFRLFAIPFLNRVFGRLSRSTALGLALVLPAVVWAFAHSNYPVFPIWVRGVELTIAGVAFGLLFLHSGFLSVVIAHYVIDAVFLSTPLLGSKNPTYVTSGIVAILLAALPAVAAIFARRRALAPGDVAAPSAR